VEEHLCILATGAPLTARCADLAASFVADGWTVRVALTDAAQAWADESAIAAAIGANPRSTFRYSGAEPRGSEPDAVVVCPATFNTIGKAATGISDTYVHSLLCEVIGAKIPTLMVPMVKHSLWNHPAWKAHLERLSAAGVWFLDPATGAERAAPVTSGTGAIITALFDPKWVVSSVRQHSRTPH